MIEFALRFFEFGNIMKNALHERKAVFLAYLFRLRVHPYDMPVAVLFAEFEFRRGIRGDHAAHCGEYILPILPINEAGGVALRHFAVFFRRIAGKRGHAVGKIFRFQNIGNFIDGDSAGDRVDDLLHFFRRLRQFALQTELLPYVVVNAV